MEQMKKGILLSLGLTLVALIILGLAVLIYNDSSKNIERFNTLSLFERLNAEYLSAEKGISRIFNVNSNVNLSLNGFNITIQDAIPNNYTNLKDKLMLFRDYAGDNFANTKITLSDTTNSIKFTVNPHLINYTQIPSNKKIIINYNKLNFLGLNFNFNTGNSTVGTIAWQEFDGGAFPVSISIANSTGSLIQDSKNIDMTDEWEVRVNGLPGGEGRIKVEFDNDDKEITIENDANILVNSKTEILLNKSDYLSLTDPSTKISVNFSEAKLSKVQNARLLYSYY
ncbi:hypothetical protein HYX19_04045 [Candidatus Woesearchaeota archaeon]|nr:hypothetical protein [Candidatus Woesearchaeota archaeon]